MITRALLVALLWSIPSQVRAQEADSESLYGMFAGYRIGSPEKFSLGAMMAQTIWVGETILAPPPPQRGPRRLRLGGNA
jgi:hypothetical protein